MIRRPPRSTRTDTLFPYTTLFRSKRAIELLRHEAVMAEYFGAQVSSPQIACLTGLRQSDLVVLVLGTRYGVKQASGLSRSEEHTSELQSLMRISYAVFCLQKKIYPLHYFIPSVVRPRTYDINTQRLAYMINHS